MDLTGKILALVEPSIQPKKIETNSRGEETDGDRVTKTLGMDAPVIFINEYVFEKGDIRSFDLSSSGVLPTASITIVDRKNVFTVDAFPRDGDVFTVFINSKNPTTFKSIHLDFEILNITAEPKRAGDPKIIRLYGRVKVPKIFAENCQYLEEGTSLDHITAVSKELGLGLASNIDDTVDVQSRIQPFIDYFSFVKEIVDSSYINDDSFQTYFIDPYYYLNFVNVNSIINSQNPSIEKFEESIASMNVSLGEENFTDDTIDDAPTKLFLTNKANFKAGNQYINKYRIENNSNSINELHAHFRDVQIYDDNSEERLDEFRIEAISTNPERLLDIEEPLKGNRESEEYQSIVKHKYMGRQDVGEEGLGNSHPNYIYSKLHNMRNNDELQKVKLVVTLESFNPSLFRFQKVPVLMYHTEAQTIKVAEKLDEEKNKVGFKDSAIDVGKTDKEEQPDHVLDQFLSGYYIVESINLIYRQKLGKFYQEVTLLRREWPSRITTVK